MKGAQHQYVRSRSGSTMMKRWLEVMPKFVEQVQLSSMSARSLCREPKPSHVALVILLPPDVAGRESHWANDGVRSKLFALAEEKQSI